MRDYFMEVSEKGVYDSMLRMQKFRLRALLEGGIVRLNTIQGLDVVGAYTIKRKEEMAEIYHKDRFLYEYTIEKLFDKGCDYNYKGRIKES
jgi:hypothetical protein